MREPSNLFQNLLPDVGKCFLFSFVLQHNQELLQKRPRFRMDDIVILLLHIVIIWVAILIVFAVIVLTGREPVVARLIDGGFLARENGRVHATQTGADLLNALILELT